MTDYMVFRDIDEVWKNSEIKGIHLNLTDGVKRTFCKCGRIHANKNSWNFTCDCGNKEFLSIGSYSYSSKEIYRKYFIKNIKNGFEIRCNVFDARVDNAKKEYFAALSEDDWFLKVVNGEIIFNKDATLTLFKTYWGAKSAPYEEEILNKLDDNFVRCISLEDVKKADSKNFFDDWKDFYYLKTRTSYKSYSSDIYNYFKNLLLKKNIPWMYDDKNNFYQALITENDNSQDWARLSCFRTLRDFVSEKQLYGFEKFLKEQWFVKNINRIQPSTMSSKKRVSTKIVDAVFYYMEHYKISYHDSLSFIAGIDNLKFDVEDEDLFIKYMKDNYITYRSSTANRYKEDKEYIVLKKLPKVYETFRNLKLFKNIEQIEEIGYAENRVNAFSDSFYDNPMKAVSYLKSKKALTKKEVDEFLGTQTK